MTKIQINRLLFYRKWLDTPDTGALLRNVFNTSNRCFESRRISVTRHRNDNFHIVCCWSSFELTFSLKIENVLRTTLQITLLCFALIMYSTRLCACRSMTASIQISGLTWVFRRYDISSNSPSGGMNEMVRSFSKRDSRTHWWNFTSSNSTDLLLPPETASKTGK